MRCLRWQLSDQAVRESRKVCPAPPATASINCASAWALELWRLPRLCYRIAKVQNILLRFSYMHIHERPLLRTCSHDLAIAHVAEETRCVVLLLRPNQIIKSSGRVIHGNPTQCCGGYFSTRHTWERVAKAPGSRLCDGLKCQNPAVETG